MNLQDFKTKVGHPNKFIFRGQCYDAGQGIANRKHCAVCDRLIRQIFVLHNQHGQKFYLGSGCINHFAQWNKPLHKKLEAARIWLRTWITAVQRDRRTASRREALKMGEAEYKTLKKQAAAAIREYHQKTGKQWLPENLFELQTLLGQKPGPAKFSQQAVAMRKYLAVSA